MQKFGKFCLENANSWHFDVEISLAKGIIFRKIGLANGAILKQWAAHPCPKFSREPEFAALSEYYLKSVEGIVEPHFNYCCSVWGSCGTTRLN